MEQISARFAKKIRLYGASNPVEYNLIRIQEISTVEYYKTKFGISDRFAKQMVKHSCSTPDEYRKKRKAILKATH